MEPLGRVAGTGAAIIGFVTTSGGALLGFLVSSQFDGTVLPLTIGFSLFSIGALVAVTVTERGRLFKP
jgi:DHA1 family bicyclomycin/chloramphenicol resistance-like MFS transporter